MAGTSHIIRIERDGKALGSQTVNVEEGKVYTLLFLNAGRSFYFPVHILQGGLGGTVGADYYFMENLRASLLGGAVYFYTEGKITPVANGARYDFKDSSFSPMPDFGVRF